MSSLVALLLTVGVVVLVWKFFRFCLATLQFSAHMAFYEYVTRPVLRRLFGR